jgi:RNA polymerase sigma-70 factor (ECF subfamily)
MNSQEGEPVATANPVMTSMESCDHLSQLFAEHHRRVLVAAWRVTGSMADAEDVAQAVFLRLAVGQAQPMANAGSYLYRAAINGALDLLRRRKAARSEPLETAGESSAWQGQSPEDELSSSELGSQLRLAIGELTPRAAEIFTLRYLEDLKNQEIAVLMGTSQAVVAVTLHKARAKLKKRIGELQRGRP